MRSANESDCAYVTLPRSRAGRDRNAGLAVPGVTGRARRSPPLLREPARASAAQFSACCRRISIPGPKAIDSTVRGISSSRCRPGTTYLVDVARSSSRASSRSMYFKARPRPTCGCAAPPITPGQPSATGATASAARPSSTRAGVRRRRAGRKQRPLSRTPPATSPARRVLASMRCRRSWHHAVRPRTALGLPRELGARRGCCSSG